MSPLQLKNPTIIISYNLCLLTSLVSCHKCSLDVGVQQTLLFTVNTFSTLGHFTHLHSVTHLCSLSSIVKQQPLFKNRRFYFIVIVHKDVNIFSVAWFVLNGVKFDDLKLQLRQ